MWEEWFQNVAGGVIKDASAAQFVQPYEIQKLRLTALGEMGPYIEGKPQPAAPAGLFGMSQGTLILLAGAALVAVFVLRD